MAHDGDEVRILLTSLVLGLALLGCAAPRGEQVTIRTIRADEDPGYGSFANTVADVIADPVTGAPVVAQGADPLKWPAGYTAWRVGPETEVLDETGELVLVTGHRYHLYFGIGGVSAVLRVEDCPPGSCPKLGFYLGNFPQG
ncbi:MAG TPA: hypothetical protein VFI15_11315 [Candidatus Limnocylindrales bacterium]|nr:hypothetical protein [Candidatus Limnocylindrales bacterium]